MATMDISKRRWTVIYVATILICLAFAVTAGNADERRALHTGAIIVIFGIVALWRLSRR
jgi:nicotinamide riboside transporter PnuC